MLLAALFHFVLVSATADRYSPDGGDKGWNSLMRHRLKEVVPERERPLFASSRFSSQLHDGKLSSYCKAPARCQTLNYSHCMGTKLPYSQTTLDLVDAPLDQEKVKEILDDWSHLIHVPKCWSVIQPFLCAVYMPRCEDGMVYLPSQEMCKMILGPCRILTAHAPLPSLFKCDNMTKYPPKCKNDVRELKFNNVGKCFPPLVKTDLARLYYDGVEGCGVQCDDPMFSDHERDQIHRLVAWVAVLCALANFFTVATFMIDWRASSKYPALVIFYINLCFMIVCFGWLAQFLPGGREDIVCRKDGTLRTAEPSAGENLSCVVVFVMVYYFLMAGIVWFVILTYAWHISLQALGKIQECMEKKGAYFHLVAWSLPLVLTITTMALGEIDGNSVSGICFVGHANLEYRAGFLLLPVFCALIIGTYFMLKGLVTLIRLKIHSEEIISERANNKIKQTILRMSIFLVLVLVFGMTSFACHWYEFKNRDLWNHSFREYILCILGVKERGDDDCRMESRPSLAVFQLHILCLFSTGILMSSWVWTSTTISTWHRFTQNFSCRLLKKEVEGEPARLKKHKVIAQAFAKRKMLSLDGRLSISIQSTHHDPVGFKFELNSGGTGSLSSTWAAALPKLVTRRGALVATTNSNSSHRRNSFDSEISYSVRRVSVESRRHSVDSAVSVKVSEVTQTLVKKVSTPLHRKGRNGRQRRLSRSRTKRHKSQNNRNSATASSNDSNLAMKLILALADSPPVKSSGPNLGRRAANAGLEGGDVCLLVDKLLSRAAAEGRTNSLLGLEPPPPDDESEEEEEEEVVGDDASEDSTLPIPNSNEAEESGTVEETSPV